MRPVKIALTTEKSLAISWDDRSENTYPLALLRKRCPCAQCGADARERGPAYIPLYTRDALTLREVLAVGSYAIQLHWEDGHNTGIYTYEYLREIAPVR